MKVLMAVSADGFLCQGPDDDMSWTGKSDKAIFKLLTLSQGYPLLASERTVRAMPPRLVGRRLVGLSRHGHTLEQASTTWPDAWLIGGPSIAAVAISRYYVSCVVLCHTRARLEGGTPVSVLPIVGWHRHHIAVDDLDVEVCVRP